MNKLEAYKAFSIVAWLTVVFFSLFTYMLVRDLQQTMTKLDAQIENRQQID